ncbi:hypothetical protein BT09F27_02060 [Escherichia coli]
MRRWPKTPLAGDKAIRVKRPQDVKDELIYGRQLLVSDFGFYSSYSGCNNQSGMDCDDADHHPQTQRQITT